MVLFLLLLLLLLRYLFLFVVESRTKMAVPILLAPSLVWLWLTEAPWSLASLSSSPPHALLSLQPPSQPWPLKACSAVGYESQQTPPTEPEVPDPTPQRFL